MRKTDLNKSPAGQKILSPVWDSVKKSLKKYKAEIILMLLCIFGSVVTGLLPPLLLEKGVDLISERKQISLILAITYLFLIILSDVLESAQGASITILGQKITQELRQSLCRKLETLPTGYFKNHDSGMIASLFVNDADTIDSLYSDGIVSMFVDCFKIISILVVVSVKSPGLGILLLFALPLIFELTRIFQRRTLKAQTDNRRAISKVNNHVPETIRNIRMIHVFSKEKYMEDKYDEVISDSYEAVNRSNIYDSIYSPVILLLQSLLVAGMMVLAARGGNTQRFFGLTAGSAVAMIAYVGKIFSPLESLGMEIQNIQSAMSGIQRINEFLMEEEWERGSGKKTEKTKDGSGTILFSNVTFGYTNDRKILENLSFEIREGENVTFMGRTGSGKSTIFHLLTGLYEPESGKVSVNGWDPCLIPASERRRIYGIVEQKFTAVPGTIRQQLCLYDPTISEEMMEEALLLTGLWQTVQELPKKMDTVFEDELFSQGQLQLLSIARAVVTSPQILLLDEITANLDSETESQILAAIKNAAKGRTVLSISHRCSVVMKEERVITVG